MHMKLNLFSKVLISIALFVLFTTMLGTKSYAGTAIQLLENTSDIRLKYNTDNEVLELIPPYPNAKVWYLKTYATDWSGNYYVVEVYRNGSWQNLDSNTKRGVDVYFVDPDISKARIRIRDPESGYCDVEYTIKWGTFINDYNEFNILSSKVDDTKSAASQAKTSADAAKSSADTAAARSYYNNNSSGYWSYNAYLKANSANTNAANAKASADTAANQASIAASNATTAVDELQNATHGLAATKTKLDITYDKAEAARSQAVSATNAAQNAKVSADSAVAELRSETYGLSATKAKLDTTYTKANTAATQAANAASRVWDSTEGKSAATLAKEARENASSAVTAANNAKASADIAVNQTTYSGQSAAYWAYVASVNAGTDTIAPTIKKVQGQNGATCTTSSSFTVVITASDNGPDSNLRYRAICDGFDSGWSSSNTIALTGLTSGPKTATIRVSDNPTTPDNGNVSHESFTFFKI